MDRGPPARRPSISRQPARTARRWRWWVFLTHRESRRDAVVHTVRLERVGLEMEVEEGETVLNAAFRQGIALMHGCKEGQCGSCKSRLISGDIELLKYSTFALPDYERETEHILLCKTHAYSDLEVELLNFDEDLLAPAIPVQDYEPRLTNVTPLTPALPSPQLD